MSLDESTIRHLREQLEAASRPQHVPLADLLPPAFMAAHTAYPTLDALVAESGLPAETLNEAAATLESDEWSTFVAANTPFASWADMQHVARVEWRERRLEALPAIRPNTQASSGTADAP